IRTTSRITMSQKFEPIFDAISKKVGNAYETGDVDAAADMYDEHGVIVGKKNSRVYFGREQIKEMIDHLMGKKDFKMLNKSIHDVGDGRFYVDVDYETKDMMSGSEARGTFHQLFHKKDDEWKCVYECFE
ncbi:hypothetical protein PMAYCL1PPCAC_22182, partial [Pristionchus mayeri]